MNIRSITYFDDPRDPVDEQVLQRAEHFITDARSAFQKAGYEVQTARFATPPFPELLTTLDQRSLLSYAQDLEGKIVHAGFEYLSLGPALPQRPDSYGLIPKVIQETDQVFFSGSLTDARRGVSLPAVRSCGQIIHRLARVDADGFANLYFAALGNVIPGAPFFPAAYHDGGPPGFALALEGADLALKTFQDAADFQDAQEKLIRLLETHAEKLTGAGKGLAETHQFTFSGIDYSLAPYPDPGTSLGSSLEALGVEALGHHGSTAAAAFLAHCIDRARFPRTGFSGLMLPVLEDTALAARAEDGTLSVKDLLLYAAVCGTGLDTLPLPGDTTPEEISAVLLDVAALSLRLDKPLTARLMPIPGKSVGDLTTFDFPYFANSKILDLSSGTLTNLFEGDDFLPLQPRGGIQPE